jgi:conserved hypothetical protein YidD
MRFIIRLYQYAVSPLLGCHCRFTPTCSQYALDAMAHHGTFAGGWMGLKRIVRCHPWGGEGYDPAP